MSWKQGPHHSQRCHLLGWLTGSHMVLYRFGLLYIGCSLNSYQGTKHACFFFNVIYSSIEHRFQNSLLGVSGWRSYFRKLQKESLFKADSLIHSCCCCVWKPFISPLFSAPHIDLKRFIEFSDLPYSGRNYHRNTENACLAVKFLNSRMSNLCLSFKQGKVNFGLEPAETHLEIQFTWGGKSVSIICAFKKNVCTLPRVISCLMGGDINLINKYTRKYCARLQCS